MPPRGGRRTSPGGDAGRWRLALHVLGLVHVAAKYGLRNPPLIAPVVLPQHSRISPRSCFRECRQFRGDRQHLEDLLQRVCMGSLSGRALDSATSLIGPWLLGVHSLLPATVGRSKSSITDLALFTFR
jgi:hypothetical protein